MAPKEKPSAPSATQQVTEPAAEAKKAAELLAVRENVQDTELGEALCYEIVQEVVGQAENLMLDNYYDRAAVPYTVQCLCREILDVVQIVFIARDPGEQSQDAQASWEPDVEPEPCPIDSWARGAVPIRKATHPPDARPPPASGEKRPKRDSSPRTGVRGKLQASGSDFGQQSGELKTSGRSEKQHNRSGGSDRTPREAVSTEGGHDQDAAPGFARPEHRRREIRDAADRQRDALKDAQGPKGGREFTVDSISGRVIPVKSMDPSRLPNRKLDVRVGVETQQVQAETEHSPPAAKPPGKRSKAGVKQTSDFVQPEDTHGPMVEGVLPSGGVVVKDGDKMARGERRHSKSRISREQFAKMLDAAGVQQRENFSVTQGSQDLRASAAQASQEESQVVEAKQERAQRTPPAREARKKSTPQRSAPTSFPASTESAPPPGVASHSQQPPAQLAPQATAPLPPFKAPREELLGQRRVYPRERGAHSPRPTPTTVDRRGLPPPLFPATERTAVPSSEGTESAPPNQSTPPRIRRYTDARGNIIADDFFAELEGDDQS